MSGCPQSRVLLIEGVDQVAKLTRGRIFHVGCKFVSGPIGSKLRRGNPSDKGQTRQAPRCKNGLGHPKQGEETGVREDELDQNGLALERAKLEGASR